MELNTTLESIKAVGTYGIFAGLFVALLVYTIKNNDKREKAYQDLIDKLNYKILFTASQNKDKIIGLAEDIDAIDAKVQHINEKVDVINAKVDTIDKKIEVLPYKINQKTEG